MELFDAITLLERHRDEITADRLLHMRMLELAKTYVYAQIQQDYL